MNLLSWIITDTYAIYRDKVNAIVSGLKEAAIGKILIANGVNVNPVWVDQWSAWTLITSNNQNGWFFDGTLGIQYRISNLDGKVQLRGQMNGSGDKHSVTEICLTALPLSISPSANIYTTAITDSINIAKIKIGSDRNVTVSMPADTPSSYLINFMLIEYYPLVT